MRGYESIVMRSIYPLLLRALLLFRRLYAQLMLQYEEGSMEQRAIIEDFKLNGSHVVRYSSHEWTGIWSDLSIGQTLMRYSKSDGGLSCGRFRNGELAHRIWVQIESLFIDK